jgi:hypothetical protein
MRKALQDAMADGQKQIDRRRASLGWNTAGLWGTRQSLKDDYVLRAVAAQVTIGANSAQEAIYQIYEKHTNDMTSHLTPARIPTRWTSPRGQEPPVKAFWLLTIRSSGAIRGQESDQRLSHWMVTLEDRGPK